MNKTENPTSTSRREFIKNTTRITAVSALAGVALPHVHAAGIDQLNVALIGCGGRGAGAASNALQQSGPPKLVAMADVFEHRLKSAYEAIKKKHEDQVDVPADRRFIGFDAYKQAMDCLKKGDVAIFTTPLAFRWVHFKYAIEKGLHVFMEKPLTADGPTSRRMLELAKQASAKNLKVGVGLKSRHSRALQELHKRIQDGEIGDLVLLRACRLGGRSGLADRRPADTSELMYQVCRFHAFLWASGGLFSDFNIHQIDECSWMKGAWPVEAHALGGRHYRGDAIDQNFDTYSVQFVYPDGTRLFFDGRNVTGCHDEFASYAHGSKGSAVISTLVHTPGMTRIYKGHRIPWVSSRKDLPLPQDPNLVWAYPQPELSPYQLEWDDLMDAIRQDKPYNEVQRGAEASLVTSMGRMAAHTGQEVSYDDILNGDHEMAPGLDKLNADSEAPLKADANGRYPIPEPGRKGMREY